MKFEFLDRRSAERFAELLDEAGGARRHHTRGQADEELNRLVAIGSRLGAARPGAPVESEFRVGLRAMLVATAERDGIGRTAVDDAEPVIDTTGGSRRSFFGRRIRARGAIVIGVAAGAMAVSGISAASESASPGDALYGVKRSTERAQLAIAGSDVSRGQLSLDFARNRLAEAVAMDGGDPAFRTVLDDMDADTRKGVRLLNTSAVSHQDTKPLTTLDGFVVAQRKVFAPALGELSPANRDRAAASLALLEDVAGRTDRLRAGLDCEKVTPSGSDELGPKLRTCGGDDEDDASAGPAAHPKPGHTGGKSPSKQQGQVSTPKPSKSVSTTKPADAGDAATVPGTVAPTTTAPSKSPARIGATSPTPTVPVTTPPVIVDEEQDGGVLGGLLNDLF
nr:DUF5667 domain-containing protein [Actinoplanes missouriensis]